MTSINQSTEDLEERIARIKKRNEEIEKKYREAEADRLMALKDNALICIKVFTIITIFFFANW